MAGRVAVAARPVAVSCVAHLTYPAWEGCKSRGTAVGEHGADAAPPTARPGGGRHCGGGRRRSGRDGRGAARATTGARRADCCPLPGRTGAGRRPAGAAGGRRRTVTVRDSASRSALGGRRPGARRHGPCGEAADGAGRGPPALPVRPGSHCAGWSVCSATRTPPPTTAVPAAALSAQTVGAARWADWNPGHPLDTAQVGTAVALGYPGVGADAPVSAPRCLRRLAGPSGGAVRLRRRRARPRGRPGQPGHGGGDRGGARRAGRRGAGGLVDPAVQAGSGALARHAAADGSGRSLADGPTVEGLMYTATRRRAWRCSTPPCGPSGDPARRHRAAAPPARRWRPWRPGPSTAGRVLEPAVRDGWDDYPWVDRATALAVMARYPDSGARLLERLRGDAGPRPPLLPGARGGAGAGRHRRAGPGAADSRAGGAAGAGPGPDVAGGPPPPVLRVRDAGDTFA